jgi:UMF1 family MFS transporter
MLNKATTCSQSLSLKDKTFYVRPVKGEILKSFFRLSRENAWCLYDWGNSAFVTTIVAAVLPVYFAETICAGSTVNWSLLGMNISSNAMSLWGYAMAAAAFLVALMGPVLGAAADAGGRRKQFLGVMTGTGVFAAALLSLTGPGDIWQVLGLLVVGQIGFAGANVFYNSLLVSAVVPGRRELISSRGYAFGYLGGGILLAVNLLMIRKPSIFGFSDPSVALRYVFLSVAVWWSLFSIPLFIKVPEGISGGERTLAGSIHKGFSSLISTFHHIRGRKNIFRFLLAFLLYNDGVQTVIMMATVYGKTELGLNSGDLIGALLLTQAVGVPGSLIYGWLAKRFGSKKMLYAGIAGYIVIIFYAFWMKKAIDFWILAGMVGLFMGGLQAVSRGFFSRMIPAGMNAKYFGFFSISQRFASILGPLMFALINDITGNSRLSILSLLVLFVSGALVLKTVKSPEGTE